MGCLQLDISDQKAETLKVVYRRDLKKANKCASLYYYGARYYNPQSSVWQSVDPHAGKAPSWTPYRFSFNNPINIIDPDGNFELPASQAKKYQRLAHYLKNNIQEIANNKTVMGALMKYGQFTESQVKSALEWEKGPKINITQLGTTKSGAGIAGMYSPRKYGANTLNIDIDLAEQLESATGDARDILLFQLASTILHEYVHLGDANDGIDYKGSLGDGEEGNAFEIEAYGRDIGNLFNAADVLNEYNERNGIDKRYEYVEPSFVLPEVIIFAPKKDDE